MTADLKHLHHLVCRSGMTTRKAVFAIHLGSFACGLFGFSCWLLGVPDRWIFASFVTALSVFVCVTNVAWRRIEEGPLLKRMAV